MAPLSSGAGGKYPPADSRDGGEVVLWRQPQGGQPRVSAESWGGVDPGGQWGGYKGRISAEAFSLL